MSDQPPLLPTQSVNTQGPAIQSIQQASNVSWERNSSLVAKNQFAFTGPASAPVTFNFNNPKKDPKPDESTPATTTTTQQSTPQISLDTLPPTSSTPNQQQQPITQPPTLTPTPSIANTNSTQPVPIGNFQGSNKWAAYHNPTTNRPYFYCHALKITTNDCPADIQTEFTKEYQTFLSTYKSPPTTTSPPPGIQSTPSLRAPPPGFSRTNSQHNVSSPPQPNAINNTSTSIAGAPITPSTLNIATTSSTSSSSKQPPAFPPLPPTPMNQSSNTSMNSTTRLSSHQSNNLDINVNVDQNNDNSDHEGYQSSQASQVTVNHITTPMNGRGPSFSFAGDISNPSKVPVFIPKRQPIAENVNQEDLPEQHPLAKLLHSGSHHNGGHSGGHGNNNKMPLSLSIPRDDIGTPTPDGSPRSISKGPPPIPHALSTSNANTLNKSMFNGLKSPSHQSTIPPLLDSTTPFCELLKVDPLPTQKDGTFLKLTTGFRKSWRPRYIILHQGAFRWWDDIAACSKAMSSPNAIVSIVGCSAQLPPIGSHVHPKNGLYIDGNVGSIQEVIDKHEQSQDCEQASFFIRTDRLGEIDSWIHILYRNGVIDARYVLNPDLTAKSLEQVESSTHKLFEVWSRERVSSGHNPFQAGTSSVPVAQTPQHQSRPEHDIDRTSTTQIFINPADLVAAAQEIGTPRNMNAKGMYVAGGLYGHQPIPVPVQVNNKKRSVGSYYAVLFSDRIECYETYDDASLVCRYSNPDVNNSINPESLNSKPKIAHLIPLTRETTIELEKTAITNTYNEITLKLQVPLNRYRNIKPQNWSITFEECNPVTGHPLQITNPSTVDPNKSLADIPGTSLSIAEKWFTVINYCITGPLSGAFESSLWWSITRSTIPLPLVLHTCFRFIAQKGLQEEGILRVPGNKNDIGRLRAMFDACQADTTLKDPNTAAGLFKLFLRENTDGLIPRSMYKSFTTLNCRSAGAGASQEKRAPLVTALKSLVASLPILNQICLSYVIHTLTKISANANVNKMFAKNCAMVLAPNLFRQPMPLTAQGLFTNSKEANIYSSPQQMAEALVEQESIVLILIEHFNEIFPRGSPFP